MSKFSFDESKTVGTCHCTTTSLNIEFQKRKLYRTDLVCKVRTSCTRCCKRCSYQVKQTDKNAKAQNQPNQPYDVTVSGKVSQLEKTVQLPTGTSQSNDLMQLMKINFHK